MFIVLDIKCARLCHASMGSTSFAYRIEEDNFRQLEAQDCKFQHWHCMPQLI